MNDSGDNAYQRAIAQARQWSADDAGAEALIRAVPLIDRERRRYRRRLALIALGLGVVALSSLVAMRIFDTPPELAEISPEKEQAMKSDDPRIAQLGRRVTIAPSGSARYRVLEVGLDSTAIEVLEGSVAFRLHHRSSAHRLAVYAGEVRVVAVGTTFGVTMDGEVPQVVVREGQVELLASGATSVLGPSGAPPELAPLFTALAATDLVARPEPTDTKPPPKPALKPEVRPTAADRWHQARLLRAQGDWRQSLTVLERLSAEPDPEWSPLALIERMRIYESIAMSPDDVARLGEEFQASYPDHTLHDQARRMTCTALRHLKRDLPPGCSGP